MSRFSYPDFTTRNHGFVTPREQDSLRDACVLVVGTGGMGGSAIMTLIRAGVGRLIIADIDAFEVSNLNRQVFATLATLDMDKSDATRAACLQINPEAQIEVLGKDWATDVARLVSTADIVVNGTDDLGASLLLYRTARKHRRCVIDAYASPLPSVYVTGPDDPMPEERFDFGTLGVAWNAVNDDMRAAAGMSEAIYVLTHSSARQHIDLALAGEVIAGTRSRMSFAPLVITAGVLMGGEAINGILKRPHGADYRGWFFNPQRGKVEHPRPRVVAALLRPLVRRQIAKMLAQ